MQLWYYKYLSTEQMERIAYLVWHGLVDPDELDSSNVTNPTLAEAIKFAKDCKRQMKVKEY